MTDTECIHGIPAAECAVCSATGGSRKRSAADRTGQEKLLILCLAITDDSLLHFNRQGESYRLRAFVGRLAGRPAWTQPDADTATEFLRRHAPVTTIDVAGEQLAVERVDRWAEIIRAHNRRLGIGA